MKGKTNMNDVNEQGTFTLLEEGEYLMKISEVVDTDKTGLPLTSKNGDPMIKIMLEPVDQPNVWVWDNIIISDNVNSPGYQIKGRSKHFLHCIGEPYEGEFDWNSDNWKGKRVKVSIKHEPANEYHKYIKAVVDSYILDEEGLGKKVEEAEIPF
jgi:hypothetical protein